MIKIIKKPIRDKMNGFKECCQIAFIVPLFGGGVLLLFYLIDIFFDHYPIIFLCLFGSPLVIMFLIGAFCIFKDFFEWIKDK